ncbi:MAG: hypothetical protein P4L81_08555, partial [Candidatus Pacebacteria bacterium]|nr:hypothetical protein [Candidatus Paceibacterota bacterium]
IGRVRKRISSTKLLDQSRPLQTILAMLGFRLSHQFEEHMVRQTDFNSSAPDHFREFISYTCRH